MTYGLLPGAQQRDVAVEGVRFALNVAGPKHPPAGAVPVLLLHGVPETAVCFRFLLPELAKDRTVLAPDLKGLGASEVVGPYDVPTLVRELAALVLHEIDAPVDVVGHDWGGALAIALARARPDLVRRLVVVNGPYRHIDLLRAWHIPFFSLPVLPEAAFRAGGRRLVAAMLRACWRADRPLDPVVRTHYERVYTEPERVAAMLSYYRANTRRRLGALLAGMVGGGRATRPAAGAPRAEPSLVVWGAADPVLPVPVGEAVVRDLGAETTLVTLPRVGHFPLEEAPDDAVPLIARFLRGSAEPLPVEGEQRPRTKPVDLAMPVVPGEG